MFTWWLRGIKSLGGLMKDILIFLIYLFLTAKILEQFENWWCGFFTLIAYITITLMMSGSPIFN